MSVRLHERIGICKTDRNGNITELQRASFGQGWIFKDWDAFHCHRDAPCYVPELSDTVYTGNDLLSLCNGQEEIAEELFYEMDWQSPLTLINEWETDGEISTCAQCGKLLLADEKYSCPYCGSSIERI